MIRKFFKTIIPKKYHLYNYVTRRAEFFLNGIVHNGPFKGMLYINKAHVSFVCHKVTGTYEKEIQHIIRNELPVEYDAIFDIGSAEGYYAVGMAKFSKAKKVVSFEGSNEGRKLQTELASLNKVENQIELNGYCDEHILKQEMLKYDRILLICDVDSYELALLNNKLNKKLNETTMIIESHNHCYERMESDLINRFSHTHTIKSIPVRTKADYKDYPNPNLIYRILPRKYKEFPIRETERAEEDSWLYLKPKSVKY